MTVELYYYGAPGEFIDAAVESVLPMLKESYVGVVKKNVKDRPLSFDEEVPASPYVCLRRNVWIVLLTSSD